MAVFLSLRPFIRFCLSLPGILDFSIRLATTAQPHVKLLVYEDFSNNDKV